MDENEDMNEDENENADEWLLEINPSPNTQQLSGFSSVCVHMCMARWDE